MLNSYLQIVCPKILKIMPVDAYNASVILKLMLINTYLLYSKIMPALFTYPYLTFIQGGKRYVVVAFWHEQHYEGGTENMKAD